MNNAHPLPWQSLTDDPAALDSPLVRAQQNFDALALALGELRQLGGQNGTIEYRGVVTAVGGTRWAGTGNWTVTKGATGIYTVTLTGIPSGWELKEALANCQGNGALDLGLSVSTVTASAFGVRTWDRAAGAQDREFSFTAYVAKA